MEARHVNTICDWCKR